MTLAECLMLLLQSFYFEPQNTVWGKTYALKNLNQRQLRMLTEVTQSYREKKGQWNQIHIYDFSPLGMSSLFQVLDIIINKNFNICRKARQ